MAITSAPILGMNHSGTLLDEFIAMSNGYYEGIIAFFCINSRFFELANMQAKALARMFHK